MQDLSHFDEHGASRMVDVGDKPVTARQARAHAQLQMQPATLKRIRDRGLEKGDVLEVARLAGIMAAKRTDALIPLCHSLPLSSVEITFDFPAQDTLTIETTVRTVAQTGVEMEALTAATIAALTVYDMAKAIDRGMEIRCVYLIEKQGGNSGHFVRSTPQSEADPPPPASDAQKGNPS